MNTILVHFDIEEEYVLLDTFVASAEAAKKTLSALSTAYFEDKLEFEIVVLPPASGSLKQYIGVVLKKAWRPTFNIFLLLQILDSGTVQDLSKEYLGDVPSRLMIEKINKVGELIKEFAEDEEQLEVYDKLHYEKFKKELESIAEELLSQSAANALAMTREELNKSTLGDEEKQEIAEAQSQLFSQALNDPNVRALGFSENEHFPIPRSNFAQRAIPPKPRKEEEPEEDWVVSMSSIRVTSPNFDREDQNHRKWKGRLISGAQVLFEVEDEEFWLKLKSDEIEFTEATVIKAQIAARRVNGRIREQKVVRVLSIDETFLATPLTDDALAAVLGRFTHHVNHSGEPDLFEGG